VQRILRKIFIGRAEFSITFKLFFSLKNRKIINLIKMFVHNIFRLKFLCDRFLKYDDIYIMGGNVELLKSI